MLYVIASGAKIDTERTERFGRHLERLYADPFRKPEKKPESAAEITTYLVDKMMTMKEQLEG